jgi:integrase/recombinase XerD
MKAPAVRLKIRVRFADGSRPFLDPVLSPNGKLKPHYAYVDGKPEHRPEGSYFLRYARDGKRVWEPVGSDAQHALTEKLKTKKKFEAKAAGVAVVEDKPQKKMTSLTWAVTEYLGEIKDSKSKKTYAAYQHTLELFKLAVAREHLEEIERKDMLAFVKLMADRGNGRRTQANRVNYIKCFFNRFGLKAPLLKTDKIKYTQKAVTAYSPEELKALFAAANQEELELFQFFLCTGARDGEVQHACWSDINFARRTFKVAERLDLEFTPKDKEEGHVPLPDYFLDLMKARRDRSKDRLIFPGTTGKTEAHFLRILKRLARRAGLNCGNCFDKKGRCCANSANCKQFGLHRFRKTFATMHHEAGVSARTIQRWLRHSSLDTTLRYLAGSDDQSERTRSVVNSTFAEVGQ